MAGLLAGILLAIAFLPPPSRASDVITQSGCDGELATDRFGVNHRVYSALSDGSYEVFYENDRGMPQCAFNEAVVISTSDAESLDPQIALELNASLIYVSWYENVSGAALQIFTMSDDNGTSWLLNKPAQVLPQNLTVWDVTYWNEFLNITVDGLPYDYISVPVGIYQNLYRVAIRNYSFDTRTGEPPLPPELKITEYPPSTDGYYLVQVKGTIEQDWLNRTADHGVSVFDFVPFSSFIVRMNETERADLVSEDFVQWTGIFQPAYKISPLLDSATGTVNLTVLAFGGENVSAIGDAIVNLGGSVLFEGDTGLDGLVLCSIDASKIPDISRIYGVYSIGPSSVAEVSNDQARLIVQSGGTTAPIHDAGLRGAGQRIVIADTGLDVAHEAFFDQSHPGCPGAGCNGHRKVFDYFVPVGAAGDLLPSRGFNFQSQSCTPDHGTHVGGSLAGDAPVIGQYSGNPRRDGEAFQGLLIVEDIKNTDCVDNAVSPPAIYRNLFDPMIQEQAFIHSNSWGRGFSPCRSTGYAAWSRQVDDWAWAHPDHLILFSAGNCGPAIAGGITFEAQAKNTITVGASGSGAQMNNLAWYSSRGPSEDLRLKPTLIAPGGDGVTQGDGVWSAQSGTVNQYVQLSGTSMATPHVAGAAGLVREYFVGGWYPGGYSSSSTGFQPSSALTRAVLIGGTSEISGGTSPYGPGYLENFYPNNQQGWGRVNLDRSLYLSGDSRKLAVYDERQGLATGQYVEFDFRVTATTEDTRVVLVWTDRPGNPDTCGPALCLVNNLDLQVTRLDQNKILKGNVFERREHPFIGRGSVVGGSFDVRNTEEAVMLLPGRDVFGETTYRIRVTGTNVPLGPQPFAIVVTGRITEFRPTGWHVTKGFQPLPTSQDTADGGIDWGYIDGDGLPDAVFMGVAKTVGSGVYYYRIGWDFDPVRGDFRSWSPNMYPGLVCPSNPSACQDIQGAGFQLLNVDGDALPDAIFMAIDSPDWGDNYYRYRVFYDMNVNGVFTGTSTLERGGFRVGSWNNLGGGLACAYIGGGIQPDCLFMGLDDAFIGQDNYRYLVAYDISSGGNFASTTGVKGYADAGCSGQPGIVGAGVTLLNVGGGATLDAVFARYCQASGRWIYRVAFDINPLGDFVSGWSGGYWSRNLGAPTSVQGGDVAAEWLDGYYQRDVMFMVIADAPGLNLYEFQVGYNIDSQGRFAN